MSRAQLILLRHGQSQWNRRGRFTGWTDVDLSPRGIVQAREAGRLLREHGFGVDLCFTSVLRRAVRSAELVLEAMALSGIAVEKSWRLNERHYGALQGLGPWAAIRRYGLKNVCVWRGHFAAPPPAIERGDARFPGRDPLYASVPEALLPRTESLADTLRRVLDYWEEAIAPRLREGKRILIVGHRHSLRALRAHLEDVPPLAVPALSVLAATPVLYELDAGLRPISRRVLGNGRRARLLRAIEAARGRALGA